MAKYSCVASGPGRSQALDVSPPLRPNAPSPLSAKFWIKAWCSSRPAHLLHSRLIFDLAFCIPIYTLVPAARSRHFNCPVSSQDIRRPICDRWSAIYCSSSFLLHSTADHCLTFVEYLQIPPSCQSVNTALVHCYFWKLVCLRYCPGSYNA